MNSTKHTEPKESLWSKDTVTWIGGSVVILCMAVVAGVYWDSVMTVQQVRFGGNNFVLEEDLASVDIPTGVSPDSLDFMDLQKQFEAIDYVKKATINVEPNGNLHVEITEREPVALLMTQSEWVYVDEAGLVLPEVSGKMVDVPLLYGYDATAGDTLTSEEFQITAEFLRTIKKAPVTNATVSEVVWSETDGIVAMTNDNGVKLTFGKDDFERRIRNWEAFYKEIVKQKGMAAMNAIDLRFDGQIVTREKP